MGRKTIEQRINLDGGQEIIETLRAAGQEGERAFRQIEQAAASAGSPGARLGASIDRLRGRMRDLNQAARRVRTSFRNLRASGANFASSLGRIVTRAAGAAAAIAGAGAALIAFTRSGTQAVDEAGKTADAVGLTIEQFTRLQFAAEQAGVSQEQLRTSLTRLNRSITDAQDGTGRAADAFSRLGVEVTDSNGKIRSQRVVLEDVADALSALPAGAERSALAVDLLGQQGAQLLPLLLQGSQGIRRLGDEADRLGRTLTQEQRVIAEAFQDSLGRLNSARRGLQQELSLLFAPPLTGATDLVTDRLAENRQAIVDFTDNVIARAKPLIEDFFLTLAGQDDQVSDQRFIDLRDAVVRFGESLGEVVTGIVVPAFQALQDVGARVADAINRVFDANITGQQVLIAAAIGKLLGVFSALGAAIGVVVASIQLVVSVFAAVPAALKVVSAAFVVFKAGAVAAGAALATIGAIPALIIAGLAGLGTALFVFWDEIVDAARAAFAFIGEAASSLGTSIRNAVGNAVAASRARWSQLQEAAGQAFDAIVERAGIFAEQTREDFARIGEQSGQLWGDFRERAVDAFNSARASAQEFGARVAEVWSSIASRARSVWDGVTASASDAGETIGERLSSAVSGAFDRISSAGGALWDGFLGTARSAINRITGLLDRLRSALRSIRSAISSAASAASSAASSAIPGFARGGKVRGPGTATSDSIPAWLSDGEFVLRARAVRHYGKDFLDALNSMRLPRFATGGAVSQPSAGSSAQKSGHDRLEVFGRLPRFADGGYVSPQIALPEMPKFSAGGFVEAMGRGLTIDVPRFAAGGEVAAPSRGRPVNVNIDGQTFAMEAQPDTVEELTKFATGRRVRSAGRKPAWYGR